MRTPSTRTKRCSGRSGLAQGATATPTYLDCNTLTAHAEDGILITKVMLVSTGVYYVENYCVTVSNEP